MERHKKYIVDGYVALISSNSHSGGWLYESYGYDSDGCENGRANISKADHKVIKYNKMFSGKLSKALLKKNRMEIEVEKDKTLKKNKKHVFRLKRLHRKINKIIKQIDPRSKCKSSSIGVTFVKDKEIIAVREYDGQEGFQLMSDTKWINVTTEDEDSVEDEDGGEDGKDGEISAIRSRRIMNRYNASDDDIAFASKVRADESESEYEEIVRNPIEPIILIDRSIIETIRPDYDGRVNEFETNLIKYYFNIDWIRLTEKDDRIVVAKNMDLYTSHMEFNKMITVENLITILHELQGNPKYGFLDESMIAKFHEKMEGNFGDVTSTTYIIRDYIMDKYFNLNKCYHKLDDIFRDHRDHNDFDVTVNLVHELQRCNYDSDLDFDSDSDSD